MDWNLTNKQSSLWESIVQSAWSPICAFDLEFRLTAFNQAHSDEFHRIYGYRVQVGDVFPDLFLPDQAPVIRGFMSRALRGEQFSVVEEFGDPSLDRPYWEIIYTPLRDAEGRIVGAFHQAQDISARLRAEALLSEARLRLVVEGARDHVILTTAANGVVTSWSAGAEAILGWTAAEIIGQPSSTIFTPGDRTAGIDRLELETAARNGRASNERWHLRKDGGRVFLNGSVHSLPADAETGAQGFLKIARDETDRRRAQVLREALIKLTDKFRGLEEPGEISFAAAEVLADVLGASRVGYGTIVPRAETLYVESDWTAAGVDSDEAARVFRACSAHCSNLMPPTIPI